MSSFYKNSQNKEQPMFVLNIDYAKQILMRESKYVRRAVVLYLNKLEDRVKELEKTNIYKRPIYIKYYEL